MRQTVEKKKVERFQSFLLDWYRKNKRSLPWRETTDPYAILVSEVMLQQTQVDRVIPKYLAWLEQFPTCKALAEASVAEVLRLWSGLGYNNRALRLQQCAQKILEKFNGSFPEDPEQLETLPGIGPYTARAVLIFSFNKDIATVDTNIRRIFIHEFGLAQETSDKELFAFASVCVPQGKSRDWHNALMDYGATLLTARKTKIKSRTTQSKFIGSKRWYRGNLLKRLVAGETLTVGYLEEVWERDEPFVLAIISELQQEGFIAVENEKVALVE